MGMLQTTGGPCEAVPQLACSDVQDMLCVHKQIML